MPIRVTPLVNNHYYHVYNRGVAKQPTFSNSKDYERLMLNIFYYRYDKVPKRLSKFLQLPKADRDQLLAKLEQADDKNVELVAFCLMPNHFHLLLKQVNDGGVSKFMKQITDSYTRYFNTKYERVGPLFQGSFKAVHVESDEQLIHLSRYIHLNPLASTVIREEYFLNYPWSSLKSYIDGDTNNVSTADVLTNFKSGNEYKDFVMDQAEYAKELEKIKHLTLET